MKPAAVAAYRELLQEIKYRIEAINAIVSGQVQLRKIIAEETCYLQLRMICETIAVGCLILHGNLKPKPDLLKTTKASWIISELQKLHPKFFPVSLADQDILVEGIPDLTPRASGFLTQAELSELWAKRAGDKLHRGSFKNFNRRAEPDFQKIVAWTNKIVLLLNRHIVTTPDEKYLAYFVMHSDRDGQPFWALLEMTGQRAKPGHQPSAAAPRRTPGRR